MLRVSIVFMLRQKSYTLAPDRALDSPTLSKRWKVVALLLLLLFGTFLLLYKFPSVPVGLHQDEMSEAYESYSLLHTGADRWGYHLPVYFIGWGSGQNVLQAYLSIPVVAALGLTRVSARLIPILCGLLTLPLFFFTLRRWFNENTALLGLVFLVFSPWHIMFSRWGVENSPLPFFMLLGIYTFGKALQSRSAWPILLCLLPFAMALYTYGIVIVVLPMLLPLLFLLDPASILNKWRAWLGAVALFCVASMPLFFFTFKNYISKRNYGFERHLPFSVPLLPISRLAQIHQENAQQSRTVHNLLFLRHGFTDLYPQNQVASVSPVPFIVLLLALAAAVFLMVQIARTRRLHEPFLLCALSCLPLFLLMPMDMSRATALYLPVLALAAIGGHAIFTTARLRPYRMALAAICLALFLIPLTRFLTTYYGPAYAAQIGPTFHPELPDALAKTLQVAGPSVPIYVTDQVLLNYVNVLYLTKTDPRVFQHSGATYNHPDFGRYRFSRTSLTGAPRPLAYLIKIGEPPVCEAPVLTQRDGQFEIGVCR
jgi:4-amino-4-deoxy-L-arabinose transferase-like glycosyltransferase